MRTAFSASSPAQKPRVQLPQFGHAGQVFQASGFPQAEFVVGQAQTAQLGHALQVDQPLGRRPRGFQAEFFEVLEALHLSLFLKVTFLRPPSYAIGQFGAKLTGALVRKIT